MANRPGWVIRVSRDVWLVKSDNTIRRYRVLRTMGVWECERDGEQPKDNPCRHVVAVEIEEAGTQHIVDNPVGVGGEISGVENVDTRTAAQIKDLRSPTEVALQRRAAKGQELFRLGLVEENHDGYFFVASQTTKERHYRVARVAVSIGQFRWTCQCEDSYWWSGPCKHVMAVWYYLNGKYGTPLPFTIPQLIGSSAASEADGM